MLFIHLFVFCLVSFVREDCTGLPAGAARIAGKAGGRQKKVLSYRPEVFRAAVGFWA